MWEIDNISQINGILYAVILGVIFAVFYDILRSLRSVKNHTAVVVFIEDILYFIIVAIVTFIFFLGITAGEIRAYIIFGIALGFFLFFATLSKYSLLIFTFFLKLIIRFLRFFNKCFYLIFNKIDGLITKFSKNTLKCFKKGLKMLACLLYTNRK